LAAAPSACWCPVICNAVTFADDTGQPVATIGSLTTRPLSFAPKPYVVDWRPMSQQPTGTVGLPAIDEVKENRRSPTTSGCKPGLSRPRCAHCPAITSRS
jgi:hypothetical protein